MVKEDLELLKSFLEQEIPIWRKHWKRSKANEEATGDRIDRRGSYNYQMLRVRKLQLEAVNALLEGKEFKVSLRGYPWW